MITRSKSIIAIPPGETIKEQLEINAISKKEFAEMMDMTEEEAVLLISGDLQISSKMAAGLENALGVPAGFWTGLEATYRDKLAKAREENAEKNS